MKSFVIGLACTLLYIPTAIAQSEPRFEHNTVVSFNVGTNEVGENIFDIGVPMTFSEFYAVIRQDYLLPFPDVLPDFRISRPGIIGDTYTIAETAIFYLVEAGDLINEAAVESGMYSRVPFDCCGGTAALAIAQPPMPAGSPFYHEFYLALYAPYMYSDSLPGDAGERIDIYGWLHLSISQDGFNMLDNAVSYFDPRGIITGSTTPIPSPAGVVLLTQALACFGLSRSRR